MKFVPFFLALVFAGCDAAPLEPEHRSAEEIRERLIETQLQRPATVRWELPIQVQTNGIARAEEALRHYEAWSGGLIRFTRVSGVPTNGLVIVEGGAMNPGGPGGCGNVHDGLVASSRLNVHEERGALRGVYTVRLGSEGCDDEFAGHYASAVAEHELGHALGLLSHFPGFVGNEGASDPFMMAVLLTLYANPIGTSTQNIRVYGVLP